MKKSETTSPHDFLQKHLNPRRAALSKDLQTTRGVHMKINLQPPPPMRVFRASLSLTMCGAFFLFDLTPPPVFAQDHAPSSLPHTEVVDHIAKSCVDLKAQPSSLKPGDRLEMAWICTGQIPLLPWEHWKFVRAFASSRAGILQPSGQWSSVLEWSRLTPTHWKARAEFQVGPQHPADTLRLSFEWSHADFVWETQPNACPALRPPLRLDTRKQAYRFSWSDLFGTGLFSVALSDPFRPESEFEFSSTTLPVVAVAVDSTYPLDLNGPSLGEIQTGTEHVHAPHELDVIATALDPEVDRTRGLRSRWVLQSDLERGVAVIPLHGVELFSHPDPKDPTRLRPYKWRFLDPVDPFNFSKGLYVATEFELWDLVGNSTFCALEALAPQGQSSSQAYASSYTGSYSTNSELRMRCRQAGSSQTWTIKAPKFELIQDYLQGLTDCPANKSEVAKDSLEQACCNS
jgi:hypothetical protein